MVADGTTPDLILREAARLFSLKGFEGTSTREIAEAVGIRQPSLFHHFGSKTGIADALYAYDHGRSPLLRGELELADATPPVALYQLVRREVEVEVTSAYDLRGLYLTAVIEQPEFARWKRAYDAARAVGKRILRAGIDTGDFVDHNVDLAIEIIDATMTQSVRWPPENRKPADPDEVAAMMLRLVIARPSRISAIRRAADRALAARASR